MGTLDNEVLMKSLDSENMLQSIQDFPDQIHAAWDQAQALTLPTHYIQSHAVVILGIGASGVAGELARAVGEQLSRRPILVTSGPALPAFVDSSTLVIAVSYTGRTPEIVSAFTEAGRRGAKLLGISAGGEVAALCRKYRAPSFSIQYGAHPRAALGYLIVPLLTVLERLGLLEFEHREGLIDRILERLRATSAQLQPQVPTMSNRAKQLAERLLGHLPVIVGSRVALPVIRRWQQQLQQNAKVFTVTDDLPHLIHSSLEGLSFPAELPQTVHYLSIVTSADTEQESELAARFRIHIKRNRFEVDDLVVAPAELVVELIDLMFWSDYVSYYLALLGGVDPSATPNIRSLLAGRAESVSVVR